jgi:hypothetical protein
MFINVRGCPDNPEAGGSRQLYGLSVMAQVSNGLPGLLRNHTALLIVALGIILVIGGVIFPAVWSARRRAAWLPSTCSIAFCGGGAYLARVQDMRQDLARNAAVHSFEEAYHISGGCTRWIGQP